MKKTKSEKIKIGGIIGVTRNWSDYPDEDKDLSDEPDGGKKPKSAWYLFKAL